MSRIKKITEGLYQGALRHVSEDGVPEGVDAIVLMAEKAEPIDTDVPIFYLPIPDDPNGLDNDVFNVVYALANYMIKFKTVLTVCHMGENRSGLMSVLILIVRGVMSYDAIDLVQNCGPVNSTDCKHSFWNPGFVTQAEDLC